jgi:ABC-2 type transport system permease protein
MSTRSDTVTDLDSTAAPPVLARTRPLYWSVRREIWENRSVYVAPLAAAALVVLSYLVGTIGLAARLRAAAALGPAEQQARLAMPFSMAATVVIFTTFVVGAFYCLDALYGERRDRSILFWKSLPVSDRTTVFAKIGIPLVVLPAIGFVVALAAQAVMLALSAPVLLARGFDPTTLWTRVPLPRMTWVMAYGLIVHALWFAPIYAWLLLVSGWARRLPLLWAVLPPIAVAMFEKMAFGTQQVCGLLQYRVTGAMQVAFDFEKGHTAPAVHPLRFLASPGLWSGLVVAAALVALTVRLRRRREPI